MGFWGNVFKGVKKGLGAIKEGITATLGDKGSPIRQMVEAYVPMGLGRVVTGIVDGLNQGESLGQMADSAIKTMEPALTKKLKIGKA